MRPCVSRCTLYIDVRFQRSENGDEEALKIGLLQAQALRIAPTATHQPRGSSLDGAQTRTVRKDCCGVKLQLIELGEHEIFSTPPSTL